MLSENDYDKIIEQVTGRGHYDLQKICFLTEAAIRAEYEGWKSAEEVFDQTMSAKKSGWDDCEKFMKASGWVKWDREKIESALEVIAQDWDDYGRRGFTGKVMSYKDAADALHAALSGLPPHERKEG